MKCDPPEWILPTVFLGIFILISFTLFVYSYIQINERIDDLKEKITKPNSVRSEKLIKIAMLIENNNFIEIHDLWVKEVEIHGSKGQAICYLKVTRSRLCNFEKIRQYTSCLPSKGLIGSYYICGIPKIASKNTIP